MLIDGWEKKRQREKVPMIRGETAGRRGVFGKKNRKNVLIL